MAIKQAKNKPKLHKFQLCARNREIYHLIKRFSVLANSNMVHKISWESGWLPCNQIWAKKLHSSVLCKKSGNLLHIFQFCTRQRDIFCTQDRVFGIAKFKYATRVFQGANDIAMATKFRQKSKNCNNQVITSVLCKIPSEFV